LEHCFIFVIIISVVSVTSSSGCISPDDLLSVQAARDIDIHINIMYKNLAISKIFSFG